MPHPPELLLVDDDPVVIQSLSRALGGVARLRFARSGPEALALARAQPPDVMLLDAEMQDMKGPDVLRAFKGDRALADVPVIVMTGQRASDEEAAVFELGAADVVPHSLVSAQILARVQAQLRARDGQGMTDDGAVEQGRVMVVDDDITAIQALRKTLGGMVGQITFATNGEAALQAMGQQAPDVVLLDVQMPGINGLEVCAAMKADPVLRHVPVALLTRYADPQAEAHALAMGATDFIAKPYQPAVLQARVRNLLRMKRDSDAALRAVGEHWRRLGDARVADLVASASDAILALDTQGRLALINQAACNLFGVASDDVIGRQVAAALPGAGVLMPLIAEGEARAPTPDRPLRLTIERGDGTSVLAEPSLTHLGDGDERITTLLLRDVTARDQAEQAARARLEAETASRTKSMMLSYIAHEMGNPLNAILGFGQLMTMDTAHPLPLEQARRLDSLVAAARHLQSLMRDVLDVSRFELGSLAVQLAPLDVVHAIPLAVDAVTAQAQVAAVTVQASLPDAPVVVMADAGRLQQCLINLLSNAIKYNRRDGRVEVCLSNGDGRGCVEVRDTGIGMTQEQCTQLFEPFNRLGRAASAVQGVGLGLVVTRLLVEAMGGTLSVDSVVGQGSCFTLKLPLAQTA